MYQYWRVGVTVQRALGGSRRTRLIFRGQKYRALTRNLECTWRDQKPKREAIYALEFETLPLGGVINDEFFDGKGHGN